MTGGFAWVMWVGWTVIGLGAAAAVMWLRGRHNRGGRRCPWCDYDLSATAGNLCPECGNEATEKQARRRRRRRSRWLVAAAVLLAIGIGGLVFNPGRRDGWATALPLWVARPILPWCEKLADKPLATYGPAAMFAGRMPMAQQPTRWERLLLAQRGKTMLKNIGVLALKPLEVRAPGLANPPAAPPNASDQAAIMAWYAQMQDPLETAKTEFDTVVHLAAADGVLLSPALHELMQTARGVNDNATWWWALRKLRYIGHFDAQTTRLVLSLAKDAQASTRTFALSTLLEGKPLRPAELMDTLIAALDDPDPALRLNVVGWLGKMGAEATPALPRLRAAASGDTDAWVKSAADVAIQQIQASP